MCNFPKPRQDAGVTIHAIVATDSTGLAAVRTLLREYAAFLLATLGPEPIDIEKLEAELAQLPGEYTPPYGALLLATCDGIPAGCVSVRCIHVAEGQTVGEMRRMWVRPEFRGNSLGKALVDAAIQTAQQMGHPALYLDTVAEKVPAALHLYRSLGFQECPRYNNNPVPGLRFLRKEF
ncbi:MAG TPA: GNAT family N-acetyltransferase [Acidobacteriaceae bacterium]|nr:GNAT family N-acetyltransferase [Acidobacteriaceae bacterium]